MTFVVFYRGNIRDENGESQKYAPDGEGYECDRETALARFHALLESGKQGLLVFGVPVAHVRIEDAALQGAKGKGPNERIVLSQFVEDDYAVGPWSEDAPQDEEATSAVTMPVVGYVVKMFDAVREFMIAITVILGALLFSSNAPLWFSIPSMVLLVVVVALFSVRRKRLAVAIVKDSEMYQKASEEIGAMADSLREKNETMRQEQAKVLEVRDDKPKPSKKQLN